MEKIEALPDNLRCIRTDGRKWRCKSRVMDDKKYCEIHYLKIFLRKKRVSRENTVNSDVSSLKFSQCNGTDGRKSEISQKSSKFHQQWWNMKRDSDRKNLNLSRKKGISVTFKTGKDEILPDHLRCNRTDGKQWRCKRRVINNMKLCDIHQLQGRYRLCKQIVPDSLKIQRKICIKTLDKLSELPNFKTRAKKGGISLTKLMKLRQCIAISEALDDALKKMKLKKGDLQLELIRMFLQRQVERQKQRGLEAKCKGNLMRDLPNGLMAISPALSPLCVGSVGPFCEVKIGIASGCCARRCFRSKNIETLPIGPLKEVSFAQNVANVKRVKRSNCHWCHKRGVQSMINCSSSQKHHFCTDCISERCLDAQKEVKMACPVCGGTCSCKACFAIKSRIH